MKPRNFLHMLLALLWLNNAPTALAQTSGNIVGYANLRFVVGENLFGSPLTVGDDLLSDLFPTAPAGTTISLWNSAAQQFLPPSIYDPGSGGWSIQYRLAPGEGALLHSTVLFTNTFVGNVVINPDYSAVIPPAYADGFFLLASITPISPSPFHTVTGRTPNEGDYVVTLNTATQTYSTNTYHNGAWSAGEPGLNVGQAAFYSLAPTPEPATWCLLGAGIASLLLFRRRQFAQR
jgi:hypothetical protein